MDKDRNSAIIKILATGDSNEIPFAKTKRVLISRGYSEAEISHALYQSPYDGKKNVARPKDPATKAMRENPEQAEKIGKYILEDQTKTEMIKTLASGAAANFAPGRHAQTKYTFDFFERLGLPYFRIFFGSLIVVFLIYKFNLSDIFNYLYGALIGIWIIWAFYRNYLKK